MGTHEAEVLTARRLQGEVATLDRVGDTVYNDPVPVLIDGREYVLRELPFRRVRVYVQQYLEVATEAARRNLAAMVDDDKAAAAELVANLDPGEFITKYTDLSLQVMQDSTGVTVEALEDLPGSTVLELARAIMRVHGLVIERFFALRREAAAAIAPKAAPTNGHSSRPESSPPSSAPDSTTPPSGT